MDERQVCSICGNRPDAWASKASRQGIEYSLWLTYQALNKKKETALINLSWTLLETLKIFHVLTLPSLNTLRMFPQLCPWQRLCAKCWHLASWWTHWEFKSIHIFRAVCHIDSVPSLYILSFCAHLGLNTAYVGHLLCAFECTFCHLGCVRPFWDHVDHSLPGSSVHGIFLARIL